MKYYYAGKRFTGKKLCQMYVPIDTKKQKDYLLLDTRKVHYHLGQILELHQEGDKYRHGDAIPESAPEEMINKWRMLQKEAEQKSRDYRAQKTLKRDKAKIDNMTIAEIKEYCDKGLLNREVIYQYLKRHFLWG